MGFTRSEEDLEVHQALGDYPTVDDGLTAQQLKERFDSPATTLQTDLNGLMTELEDETSAGYIGADALDEFDESDANIQAKLEKIHEEIQDVTLGEIPDGTITQAKLNNTYEATLAKKDSTLQEGLNAEKFNSYDLAGLKALFSQDFYVGTATFTAGVSNTIACGFKPKLIILRKGSSNFGLFFGTKLNLVSLPYDRSIFDATASTTGVTFSLPSNSGFTGTYDYIAFKESL